MTLTLAWSSSKQFAQKFSLFLKKHFVYKVKSVLHCLTFVDQHMAASCCYQNRAHLVSRSTTFDMVYGSFQLWAWAATFVGPHSALSIADRFPTGNPAVNQLSVISRPTLFRLNWKNCASYCWQFVGRLLAVFSQLLADCRSSVGRLLVDSLSIDDRQILGGDVLQFYPRVEPRVNGCLREQC